MSEPVESLFVDAKLHDRAEFFALSALRREIVHALDGNDFHAMQSRAMLIKLVWPDAQDGDARDGKLMERYAIQYYKEITQRLMVLLHTIGLGPDSEARLIRRFNDDLNSL